MVERWWTAFILSNIPVIKEIHRSVCLGCFTSCSWHRWFCKEIGFRKVQDHSKRCGTEPGESACTPMCTEAGSIMKRDWVSLSLTAETVWFLSVLPVPVVQRWTAVIRGRRRTRWWVARSFPLAPRSAIPAPETASSWESRCSAVSWTATGVARCLTAQVEEHPRTHPCCCCVCFPLQHKLSFKKYRHIFSVNM